MKRVKFANEKLSAANMRIEELESVVREADEYLDTNDMTTIGHRSILHRKFKAILKNDDEVKPKGDMK